MSSDWPEPCPPCSDGEHATEEDGRCTCCGQTVNYGEETKMPNIGDTCCGKCPGGTCYVDQVTGA